MFKQRFGGIFVEPDYPGDNRESLTKNHLNHENLSIELHPDSDRL
jgi:hypothetical protein